MGGLLIGNNNNIAIKPKKIFVGVQGTAVEAKAVFVGNNQGMAVKVFPEGVVPGDTYRVKWSVERQIGWFWGINIGDAGFSHETTGSVNPSIAGGYSVSITAAQNPYDPSGIPNGAVDIEWIVKDAAGITIQQGYTPYTTDGSFELEPGYDVYNIEVYV